MLHLFIIPTWFNVAFCFGIALSVMWMGGRRERIAAAVVLLAGYVSPSVVCQHLISCPWWHFVAEDAAILGVCLALMARAHRYWIIWAAGFALLSVITDLMAFLPQVTFWAVISFNWIWYYLLNLTVLWAAWTYSRLRSAGA